MSRAYRVVMIGVGLFLLAAISGSTLPNARRTPFAEYRFGCPSRSSTAPFSPVDAPEVATLHGAHRCDLESQDDAPCSDDGLPEPMTTAPASWRPAAARKPIAGEEGKAAQSKPTIALETMSPTPLTAASSPSPVPRVR